MSDGCPSCGSPAVGSTAALVITRGTHETLPGVVCRSCGNLWVDESRPEDEWGDTIEDILGLEGGWEPPERPEELADDAP